MAWTDGLFSNLRLKKSRILQQKAIVNVISFGQNPFVLCGYIYIYTSQLYKEWTRRTPLAWEWSGPCLFSVRPAPCAVPCLVIIFPLLFDTILFSKTYFKLTTLHCVRLVHNLQAAQCPHCVRILAQITVPALVDGSGHQSLLTRGTQNMNSCSNLAPWEIGSLWGRLSFLRFYRRNSTYIPITFHCNQHMHWYF